MARKGLGRSNEIKVKHFDSDGTYIDDDINDWLKKNDVFVLDIKFTSTITDEDMCNDALVIYTEVP
ncbi:hypothetical protein J2S74_002235 [Evansella vedderi]|uniref:Uncharacterized protein n=1 Tax=Evansella vedderi TaxID=38282 RepID=A0ABT9ZUD6_9BACI|nr:hypothetical protein [Evansella vedderi]MDQ0254856.1 hypothetical protein [Evansella vedderi]